jgi:uncharacterized protein
MKNFIYMHGGKKYNLDNPFVHSFNVEMIAHSLSNQCRFNGHTKQFYSVAEHSVRIASYLHHSGYMPDTCLAGLLHDAGEIITGDITRPVQNYFHLDSLKNFEEVVYIIICAQFGLSFKDIDRSIIKHVDMIICDCELNALVLNEVVYPSTPLTFRFECWPPETAKKEFLEMFDKLKKAARNDLS